MQTNYRGVKHPSVHVVECPHCKAPKGKHCENTRSMTRNDAQTKIHKGRIKAYEDLIHNTTQQ